MARFRLRDGSGEVRLKWILEHRDRHGNVRIYVRRKGAPMVRLREEPGTDAFLEEYRAAVAQTERVLAGQVVPADPSDPPAPPGSLNWLLQRYYASAEFQQLNPSTRRTRRLILDKLRETKGGKPYRMMQPRHVAKLRDEKLATPEAANNLLKALRAVFKWASLPHVGLADHNPAAQVPKLQSKSEGFHSWTFEEVAAFEARHPIGSKARLALALLLYTGVRRSDVVLLGRQHLQETAEGVWLTFTITKGRSRGAVTLSIPLLRELREVIDATPSGHMNFLVTEHGKPFSAAGFGNKFRDWCDQAGLPQCSAHGLRKAGAALAAERGATEHQLMAIFGWKTIKEAERYTKAARQKVLAGQAMPLLSRKR